MQFLDTFWSPQLSVKTTKRFVQLFALLGLTHLLLSFPQGIGFYFGPEGLFSTQDQVFRLNAWSLAPFLNAKTYYVFYLITALSFVCLFLGIFHWGALVLTLLWHITTLRLFSATGWHVDALLALLNIYLFLVPPPKNQQPKASPGLRFIQIHLSLIYLIAGLSKLKIKEWKEGTAIATFFDSSFAVFEIGIEPWLSATLGYTVVSLELLLAVGIWVPRYRRVVFSIALAFHTAIFVFTKIKIFSLLMILCHFSYFPQLLENAGLLTQAIKKLALGLRVPAAQRS